MKTRITEASLQFATTLRAPSAAVSEARPGYQIFDTYTPIIGSLPWMVSIRMDNVHVCSGVLIYERYVLTSASCFGQA